VISLNKSFTANFISDDEIAAMRPRVAAARDKVLNGTGEGSEFLGWRDLPENYDREEFARIRAAAAKIRGDSDVLVVIGIGGSYLGARAVIELLGGASPTEVIFAGNNLSSIELDKVLRRLSDRNWSINVISKSGTTLEPALAFRILRDKLVAQYGAAAQGRIYATTDANTGTLHDLAVQESYERFIVPDDIGGRYSVLTAVGLLPIAAAGVDIDELLAGAAAASSELAVDNNDAVQYATIRNILYEKNYTVEILASFEPSFGQMAEWWKQLFGESEGKDGRGILPDSMTFTTDLHSLGQYVQDGRRQIFETFVDIEKSPVEIAIPSSDDNVDGLNYLAGKNLSFVSQKAYEATVLAHSEGGVPVLSLNLPALNAREIGGFIYFMEMAAALSAYTLGVNPFNQPGVEAYKSHMFRLLGRED
jgi:glucose-6-phosphate isomerase